MSGVERVTFANLVKRSGRWIVDGHRTETGTVTEYGSAVSINDPETGRMIVMLAKGLIDSRHEIS